MSFEEDLASNTWLYCFIHHNGSEVDDIAELLSFAEVPQFLFC